MTPSDGEIRTAIARILGGPEFQEPASAKLIAWLGRLIRHLMERLAAMSGPGRALVIIACVAALAVIVIQWIAMYRRAMAGPEGARRAGGMASSSEASAEELARMARALAGRGEVREAARALQLAVLRVFCRRRGLTWRPSLSDWEWARLLERPADLVRFTRRTQALAFGERADAAEFDACEAESRAIAPELR
jgi:hypothetical protein